MTRAEFQGGDREHAGSTTVIKEPAAGQLQCVERFEAQGRGRVRAGAEGEARVEAHDDRAGVGGCCHTGCSHTGCSHTGCSHAERLGARRTNPQPPAETHRSPIREPHTLPGAIGHAANPRRRDVFAKSGREPAEGGGRVDGIRIQPAHQRIGPQAHLAGPRFQHRFVAAIEEGD